MTMQFLHIDVFSLEESSKKRSSSGTKSKGNISSVCAENLRVDGYCDHLEGEHQVQPIYVYQDTKTLGREFRIEDTEEYCTSVKNSSKDEIGRKLRKDASMLLAGVCSYKREENSSMEETTNDYRFKKWLELTIDYLKEEYGDSLKCVNLHLDEGHPHVHFFVINDNGAVKNLHAGFKAVNDFKREHKEKYKTATPEELKVLKSKENFAYKKAMREMQSRYNKYMLKLGLVKYGPRRQRLSREEWKNQQAQAMAIYENGLKAQMLLNTAKKKAKAIVEEARKNAEEWMNKPWLVKAFATIDKFFNKSEETISQLKSTTKKQEDEILKQEVKTDSVKKQLQLAEQARKNAERSHKEELEKVNKENKRLKTQLLEAEKKLAEINSKTNKLKL